LFFLVGLNEGTEFLHSADNRLFFVHFDMVVKLRLIISHIFVFVKKEVEFLDNDGLEFEFLESLMDGVGEFLQILNSFHVLALFGVQTFIIQPGFFLFQLSKERGDLISNDKISILRDNSSSPIVDESF